MSSRTIGLALVMVTTLAVGPGMAAEEINLMSVLFPERVKTEVTFAPTKAAPAAEIQAAVTASKGQSRIELSFKGMKPAILFGGDVTSFVVWAVSSDGTAENLGELWVRESDGSMSMQTGLRNFALMITAEQFPGKQKPSTLLLFSSKAPKDKRAKATPFKFSNFGLDVKPDNASISALEYTGKDPIDIVEARRVLLIAESYGAKGYSPQKMEQAKMTLGQAENLAGAGDRKTMVDYARRTIALASDAIRETNAMRAKEQAAAEEARRQSQLNALKGEADRASAEADRAAVEAARSSAEAARIAEQLKEVNAQRAALASETVALSAQKDALEQSKASLENEKADLLSQKAAIEKERDELKQRLEGALGQVADTKATARGLVVNLGDILFDVGKATLKPDAKMNVAKLAGILLMLPSMNVRIEGHTDSTGKDELNMKLSRERAFSVLDLLRLQGIPESRLTSEGYGSKFPVADNGSKEGRAKNRRVEVVINEGTIQGADAKAAGQ